MALRRLAEDWAAQHGYRPVLVETFVDPTRFAGTCRRAVNRVPPGFVGMSAGLVLSRKLPRNTLCPCGNPSPSITG